jgi:TolA-binding protein
MFLIVPIILLGSLLALVVYYWRQFSREVTDFTRAWFLGWLRGGVVVPILAWLLMNIPGMPFMPPLTPTIARYRAGGNFFQALFGQMSLAALAIVSCWAALTLGWLLAALFKKARNLDDMVLAGIIWFPALPLVLWFLGYYFGWGGVGFAAFFWLWPLAHYCLQEAQTAQPLPTYSRAIGKMKFGKYGEAEMVILAELEKCETDFDGWMMLAELYANQFQDLAEAEKTILDLCMEPATTLPQVSIALHRLADWQLNLRQDPAAARRVLEEICRRMPGTLLALNARNRINQLPQSRAELDSQKIRRKIQLPALTEEPTTNAGDSRAAVEPAVALASANALVEKLQENPKDIAAREQLAKIFAEQLGRFDLGVEQLELLAEMPERPEARMPEWLALMAAWLMKERGEGADARKVLERLVRQFPQSAQAFAAQRRLSLLARDAKLKA